MNVQRLRWGEWIAGIAALNLALVTFRAWYKVSGTGVRVTAWDALTSGRYLLLATAAVGIVVALIVAADRTSELSFPPGYLAAVVGLACTVYIAYRLASPPADNLDTDLGLYFGLLSAAGVAIGGLLSAREPLGALYTPSGAVAEGAFVPAPGATGVGLNPPDASGTWSPAPPAPTPSWSPAPPAPLPVGGYGAPPPPDAGGAQPLRPGDQITLTAGGARFPAGTIAKVIQVFGGGALVEVVASDGVAERFEVPEEAFDRVPAGGSSAAEPAPGAGDSWTPALPAPAASAGDDWAFAGGAAASGALGAAATDEAPEERKVPFWKREIGGRKKGREEEATSELAASAPAADEPSAPEPQQTAAPEKKVPFWKREIGFGKGKDKSTDPVSDPSPEADVTPATDVAGLGSAAESDTAIRERSEAEPQAPAAQPEAKRVPDVALVQPEPEPEREPEPEAPPKAGAKPEPVVPVVEPKPPAASDPEPAASEPEPPARAPEAAAPPASEPAPSAPEPKPPAPEPAPPPAAQPEPEPPAAAAPPDPEPERAAETSAAAAAGGAVEQPKSSGAQKSGAKPAKKSGGRKKSSGSRKTPKEALEPPAGDQPKVGDQVKLTVSGGRWNAGTQGVVVDVFSAGVIVEVEDDDGKTERLDLPFEAVGPADGSA